MKKTVSYVLIETMVRKTLREIRDSPERSSRNLVDMALNFSEGRFQKLFFETAQQMLGNEHSAYYPLIQDIAANVDHERVLEFGMALGYNSCTMGAERIRRIEAEKRFNIPWSLFLDVECGEISRGMNRYDRLISEGNELGIYTWFVHAQRCSREILPLMSANPECAFVLFCEPEEVDDCFLEELDAVRNVMIVVLLRESAPTACARLRERRMLYSVGIPYSDGNVREILGDNLICDAEAMHAAFTVFVPMRDCSETAREIVHDYVIRTRAEQSYRTVPWELLNDNLLVDRIISDDDCSAGFERDGTLFIFNKQALRTEFNLFRSSLQEILCGALNKAAPAI
ncbi:MAG: hypothetical protein ACI4MF_13820 [Candidatus Faecivicinus sp.]